MLSDALPHILECLKDPDSDVRQAAVNFLSEITKHGKLLTIWCLKWNLLTNSLEKFHDVISAALPDIVECLNDHDPRVINATVDCISEITKHGKLLVIWCLKWNLLKDRTERFHDVISTTLPSIVEHLTNDHPVVRQATVDCLSEITKHILVSEVKSGLQHQYNIMQ